MSSLSRVDPLFLDFQLAVAGRYSLDRELGRGGMGVVYLAREVQLERLVAIKLLPPERAQDASLRERFVREARLAAKLSHPNIIPIFAVDEADGFVFYVMAYVEGETLGDRVRTRGPLPASEATRVIRDVAWALGHAHAQGVVHRDVKPDNILLEQGSGRALVTDFGIAAALDAEAGPEVAGTPEYMSPEQALGGELDARSDVYGLGATAFYACTGHPPFKGKNAVEVLAKQVATAAPALASASSGVPRRLAALVDRCLAKEPSQRPSSALTVAEQLANAAEARREVPAVLRAFVKRDGRMGAMGLIGAAYLGMGVAIPAGLSFGLTLGLPLAFGAVASLPFLYLAIRARGLLRRGFERADLGPAFESEIAQLKEEFVASGGKDTRAIEKGLGIAAMSGAGIAIGGELLNTFVFSGTGLRSESVIPAALTPLSLTAAFVSLVVMSALRGRRPYTLTEAWRKIWDGRLGKAAFAVARFFGGKSKERAATTHRQTELAIGMAADELFAALPKATRQQLGDVPALVATLQRDATELRGKHAALQDLLTDAGEAAATDGYAELRALRDELGAKHRDVVTTLETTRLNLLRLHAGAITVDGLTTHFDLADDVSLEVRRLLEARGEIERFLRFPSPVRPTPG